MKTYRQIICCVPDSSRCFGRYKIDKWCDSCPQPLDDSENCEQHKTAKKDLRGLPQKCHWNLKENEMSEDESTD